MTVLNDTAIRHAMETAGVEFIDENGGGPPVSAHDAVDGSSTGTRVRNSALS